MRQPENGYYDESLLPIRIIRIIKTLDLYRTFRIISSNLDSKKKIIGFVNNKYIQASAWGNQKIYFNDDISKKEFNDLITVNINDIKSLNNENFIEINNIELIGNF